MTVIQLYYNRTKTIQEYYELIKKNRIVLRN